MTSGEGGDHETRTSSDEDVGLGGAAHAHKPLPSIDMPLLKEERRAQRARHMWGTAGAAAAAALVVGAFAWSKAHEVPSEGPTGGGDAEQAAAAPQTAAPPSGAGADASPQAGTRADGGADDGTRAADPTPLEVVGAQHQPGSTMPTLLDSAERKTRAFGRARSFHHALLSFGIDEATAAKIEAAAGKLIDFRRCHAEHTVAIERDAAGAVTLFEYHASPIEYVRLERSSDGSFAGKNVKVPIDATRIRKGGSVRSSLGDALDALGLGRALAGTFQLALQRSVDFAKQTRSGDTFRIVVDEERIGGEFLRYGRVHALEYDGQRTGRLRAFWYEPRPGDGDFYDETGRALEGGWLRTPVRFDHISSGFDLKRRHPILKRIMPHNGVDYAAGSGTPVVAAADGTVTFAAAKGPNGNLVSIRHEGGYVSHYAHLLRFEPGIKAAVKVRQRQTIGYVGSTGRSTGPHLHFGLEKHGRFVDPIPVINGPGRPLPAGEMGEFREHLRRVTAELERVPITEPSPESGASKPQPAQAATD